MARTSNAFTRKPNSTSNACGIYLHGFEWVRARVKKRTQTFMIWRGFLRALALTLGKEHSILIQVLKIVFWNFFFSLKSAFFIRRARFIAPARGEYVAQNYSRRACKIKMAHEKLSIKINAVYLDKNVISFSPKARGVDVDFAPPRFPYFYDDCYVATFQEPTRENLRLTHWLLQLGKMKASPLFSKNDFCDPEPKPKIIF